MVILRSRRAPPLQTSDPSWNSPDVQTSLTSHAMTASLGQVLDSEIQTIQGWVRFSYFCFILSFDGNIKAQGMQVSRTMDYFPNVPDIHLLPRLSVLLSGCELTSHQTEPVLLSSLPVLSICPLLPRDPLGSSANSILTFRCLLLAFTDISILSSSSMWFKCILDVA